MKKFIYLTGLLLAVITVSISNQSCSGEPMMQPPGTVEPGTRTMGDIPEWTEPVMNIMIANLTVTGNSHRIILNWTHLYREPLDYVFIYRSSSTPILPPASDITGDFTSTAPTVMIPMGTDPFRYTFNFYYLDDLQTGTAEDYYPVYYQVIGVCTEYVAGSKMPIYRIKWMTQEVKNMEWAGRGTWPPLEIM